MINDYQKACGWVLIFLLGWPLWAHSDVLSPEAANVQARWQSHPKQFDRTDNFCLGKFSGNACDIVGPVFAGGGKGVCTTAVNPSLSTIDLSCVRVETPKIERGLPSTGFVDDDYVCDLKNRAISAGEKKQFRELNCTPPHSLPTDRFCRAKAVNAACTVELQFGGKVEQHAGICKKIVETRGYYYHGRRTARRESIQCEPDHAVTREYSQVSWWTKLRQ